jgi:hypothetical protein
MPQDPRPPPFGQAEWKSSALQPGLTGVCTEALGSSSQRRRTPAPQNRRGNQCFGSGQGCFGVFVATLLQGMVGAGMACVRLQA